MTTATRDSTQDTTTSVTDTKLYIIKHNGKYYVLKANGKYY